MAYEVHTEHVDPVPLAAIRAASPRDQLSATIYRLLDKVWPLLREQGVRTGHNVVIYHGGDAQTLDVEVGVQAFTDFTANDEVRRSFTPSGEVATTAHYGDYSEMAPAYAALERWCATDEHRSTVSWEVYGDWDDDPAKRRTDLYFLLEPKRPITGSV
jgi:effector-binding domain-containing protein